MGNRLIKFLSEVLPTHHHYYSKHPDFTILRIKIQNDLLKVRNQMDDLSYALDREVYKTVMRMQGLEFEDSPGGRNGGSKARRKKKVTFALEETHDDGRSKNVSNYDGKNRTSTPTAQTVNGPIYVTPKPPSKDGPKKRTGTNLESQSSLDLSLWETRDPEIEIVDMSTSSTENSIDVDDTSSSLDVSNSSLEAHTPSGFQEQIDDQKKKDVKQPQDFGSNMFDSMVDDGWESSLSWPEGDPFQQSPSNLGAELAQEGFDNDKNENEKVTTRETYQVVQSRQMIECEDTSETNHHDYDDPSSDSDANSDRHDIYDRLDAPMEENEPFVEKIARENVYRGINELREGEEDDDSDADDSWEQDDNDDDEASSINLDRSHSSIMSLSMEESYTCNDQSMEEENTLNSTDPESHLITLHQEFLSSFDLEEGHSFDADDSSDEGSIDGEHEQFVKDMTEMEFSSENTEYDPIGVDESIIPPPSDEGVLEFPDEIPTCDSSGGDKTVVTASTASTEETEVMNADYESNNDGDPVLGISRKSDYYPSFDSSPRNDSNLPVRLDYLEYKVKDLQVKQENRGSTISPVSLSRSESGSSTDSAESSTDASPHISQHVKAAEKSSYPVQMARSDSDPTSKASKQTETQSHSHCSKVCKKEEEVPPSSTIDTSKAHPTAARLKNLRKTAAWKRRFGSKSRQ